MARAFTQSRDAWKDGLVAVVAETSPSCLSLCIAVSPCTNSSSSRVLQTGVGDSNYIHAARKDVVVDIFVLSVPLLTFFLHLFLIVQGGLWELVTLSSCTGKKQKDANGSGSRGISLYCWFVISSFTISSSPKVSFQWQQLYLSESESHGRMIQ